MRGLAHPIDCPYYPCHYTAYVWEAMSVHLQVVHPEPKPKSLTKEEKLRASQEPHST